MLLQKRLLDLHLYKTTVEPLNKWHLSNKDTVCTTELGAPLYTRQPNDVLYREVPLHCLVHPGINLYKHSVKNAVDSQTLSLFVHAKRERIVTSLCLCVCTVPTVLCI